MKSQKNIYSLFMYPAFIWTLFFLFVPLCLVILISFLQRGVYGGIVYEFTFANYAKVFSPNILWIFLRTLFLAGLTALFCCVFGFFTSWYLSAASQQKRNILFAILALPFLTNSLIRIIGLKTMVGTQGPIQGILNFFQVAFDPYQFSTNYPLMLYGMVATYLPFAVLPLFTAFEKFDFHLIEAAQDLGARNREVLVKVLMPVMKPSLIQSFLLVFIPSLGEYAIPDLLGGAKTMLLGHLITEQFLRTRDWPFGSALSVGLFLVLILSWILARNLVKEVKAVKRVVE